MHDLRKKALLESKKTASRKARSKETTPATSKRNTPLNSRASSRVRGGSSRGGSDDEHDSELSDETSFSVGSIDEIVRGVSPDQGSDGQLADRIEEIFARKGSTTQGREKCYKTYAHLLTVDFSGLDIQGKEEELVAAFLKSVKEEASEKEAVLALKAIALTLITSPSDVVFESVLLPLKRAITHSDSILVKSAAIRALSISTFYGGASDEAILDVMDYFLEIVSSDGHVISAPDEPSPVVSASEEWGFLCTLVEDISEHSEEYVETFSEQINSSYASVQIAAGENIALLYEKSFKALGHDDDDHRGDYSPTDIISDPDEPKSSPKIVRLYPAYRRTDQLLHSLQSVSRNNHLSVHQISKDDRKALKSNFSDIANSVEFPGRGPKYSNAFDQESGKRYGSRMNVKIHKAGVMRIDSWWKLLRLKELRRVLQGGFVTHYETNEVVFETLPIMIAAEKDDD